MGSEKITVNISGRIGDYQILASEMKDIQKEMTLLREIIFLGNRVKELEKEVAKYKEYMAKPIVSKELKDAIAPNCVSDEPQGKEAGAA